MDQPTAEHALSKLESLVGHARRGRADSGDTRPYAVQRELEDLAALLDAAAVASPVREFFAGYWADGYQPDRK